LLQRLGELWRAFARADSKYGWVKRKIANRWARPRIRAAWRAFDARLPVEQRINQAFDRRFGTDTADEMLLIETGVPAEEALRGKGTYRPVWESAFHDAMKTLGIDFTGFTFVDIGSGKGKMLMMAADYPFARIVGVEYSPGLDEIAQRNLQIYRSPAQRCTCLEAHRADALDFPLPAGPLICLVFNAFDAPTMREFMRHAEDEVAARPQPAFVLYCNVRDVAEIGDGLDGVTRLRRLKTTRTLLVFGNRAAGELLSRR
jgi:SAM-dependent methyltransferase